MDLFSQAEHDELAQAILVTPIGHCSTRSRRARSGTARCPAPRSSPHRSANRGALIRVRDLDEACALADRIAPEHLELAVADPAALLPKIRHAGAIFMGHHASEALGDYCAGPNHVLPTGRTARFSSPLGVYDFQKRSSVLGISPDAARALGPAAATLRVWRGPSRACAQRALPRVRRLIMRAPADVVASIVRPEIRALSAYAVAKAEGMIKLDAMESPFPCPSASARRSPARQPRCR